MRDSLGRQSLLLSITASDLIVTSVANKGKLHNFIELPPVGIFKINCSNGIAITLFPWHDEVDNEQIPVDIAHRAAAINPIWLLNKTTENVCFLFLYFKT